MKKLYILFAIISIGIHVSCKRDFDESFRGPKLAVAGKNFEIISGFNADRSTVNFVNESVEFQALFNSEVSWTIKIYGIQSKATKTFTGSSFAINRLNALWNGNADSIYFFKGNEKCFAELSILGRQEKWYDTVTILTPKNPQGILISDFDGNGKITNSYDWYNFFDKNAQGVEVEKIEAGYFTTPDPVQNKFYHLKGDDKLGVSNYYIGGLGHNSAGLFGIPYSGTNTYYNMMYRGSTTASVWVTLTETDGDVYEYKIVYPSTGWKIFSLKLADFTKKSIAGGGIIEPNKINKVDFLLDCDPLTIAECDLDYIIFTNGSPFHP